MIIVKLIGGLGNQLFQYATARALAYRHGVEVKVDCSFLNQTANGAYTQRKYELGIFKADIKIANEKEVESFLKFKTNKLMRVAQRNIPELFDYLYVAESGNHYYKNFKYIPNNAYLEGFWQSEKYFSVIRPHILNDLQLTAEPVHQIKEILQKIETTNSISIHVRRGDYVTLANANNFHGTCSVDYYQNSVSFINERVGDGQLYVFSDDIKWCKQHFKFNQPTHFVEHTEADYWDLFLMSKCKHNIIANSSFSWWAAWLNKNEGKIVVSPNNWYQEEVTQPVDLIPDGWIKMV